MEGWQSLKELPSRRYVCGHCGNPLASNVGYCSVIGGGYYAFIYICHQCDKPTFLSDEEQVPGAPFGNKVEHISPKDVEDLYNEARTCFQNNAFTASVLCCRKLLMNIAVSKGVKEGLTFAEYVEYLSKKGYVPPGGEEWVDHIRNKGNEATHEIKIMQSDDAKDLITFAEMLLKFIYEFPKKISVKKDTKED